MIARLACLLNQHEHVYRERRDGIQHYICERCGQATPVLSRTADEHRQAVARGRVAQLKASVLHRAPTTAAERARAKRVLGI